MLSSFAERTVSLIWEAMWTPFGLRSVSLSGTGTKMIGCVHDEIILEVPKDASNRTAAILREPMERAGRSFLKTVPVVVDVSVGENWAEK